MDTSFLAIRARFKTVSGSWFPRSAMAAVAVAICLVFSACSTPRTVAPDLAAKTAPNAQVLNVGDVIRIAFPATPTMDIVQQIRRDGLVNLYIIGEVKAAGKTPVELERDLIQAYSTELLSKEIKVTVQSTAFCVYVNGAVMRPGKILPERSLTAFDAIMEAGGFDLSRADLKNVKVYRQEEDGVKIFHLNMKAVMSGGKSEPFYLKTYDTIDVPEKFSWF